MDRNGRRVIKEHISNFQAETLPELRIDHGPGYRVYYERDGQDVVTLLAGGTKKRQDRDIERARTCWEDYMREKRNADRTP